MNLQHLIRTNSEFEATTNLQDNTLRERIAIVGGGLSGTATTVHLLSELITQNVKNVEIVIFEPTRKVGPGLAYCDHLPDNYLLNHELSHMGSVNLNSLDLDDDKDFFRWVLRHRALLAEEYPKLDLANPQTHVPRRLYGKYLATRFREANAAAAQHGISLEIRRGVVIDIRKGTSGGLVIDSNDGGKECFSAAVLAPGHWCSPLSDSELECGRAFHAYPPSEYLSKGKFPKNARMLILGTGLSAVDAAIGAIESGQFSHITMTSRRGHLRSLRGRREPYVPVVLTIENLERIARRSTRTGEGGKVTLRDIGKLLQMEMHQAYGSALDWDEIIRSRCSKKFLEEQLRLVDSNVELRYLSVLQGLDSIRQQIYDYLTPKDQVTFVHQWHSLYISYRAAMPVENGRKMCDAILNGKLAIEGGLTSYGMDPETREFTADIKTQNNNEKIKADVLIYAIGHSRDYRHQPLLRQLVEVSRVATPHVAGGIRIDLSDWRVVDPNANRPTLPLYALGPATLGQCVTLPNTLNISYASRMIAKSIVGNVRSLSPTPELVGKAV